MTSSGDQVAADAPVTIYRRYDDGYIVRSMGRDDAAVVQGWYSTMGIVSKHDLDITLSVFPSSLKGFYIGEFEGRVVASAIRLPWGEDILYGSYYYVDKPYRSRGFGTRLRDEVAREHVGTRTLCVDAVMGKVVDNNEQKFEYRAAFKTGRFLGTAKASYPITKPTPIILPVSEVDFDKLIDYDNKCFVSRNFAPRRDFLRRWTQIPHGATYVALSDVTGGHVIGYGCRRPAIQASNHELGPLYADNKQVAEALLSRLCSDVAGDNVTIQIWYHNEAAVSIMSQLEFKNVFDVLHMHLNGDPNHQHNQHVYAVTSIEICGF